MMMASNLVVYEIEQQMNQIRFNIEYIVNV